MRLNIKQRPLPLDDDRRMKAEFAERERQQEEAAYRSKMERDLGTNAARFGTGPGGLPVDDLEKALGAARQADPSPRPVRTDPRAMPVLSADVGEPVQAKLLRGQLPDGAALVRFVEAGRAILTVKSRTTGERFTFRFRRPTDEQNADFQRRAPMHSTLTTRPRPIWVSVLCGPDNTSQYAQLGTMWPRAEAGRYDWHHSKKTQIHPTAKSAVAIRWLLAQLERGTPEKIFAQSEIWHEGRCARCGRKLTVPESISTGFGPECAGIVGIRN